MSPSKRERVRGAKAGQLIDRPPISFWWHNYVTENDADSLAEESVRQARAFDWDLVKVQSRFQAFSEGWGVRYQLSSRSDVPPKLVEWPIRNVTDLERIRPVDPAKGALGEQLRALRLVRRSLGNDVPILMTIFSPVTVLSYLVGSPNTLPRHLMVDNANEVGRALGVISESLAAFSLQCVAAGADGIFFAINLFGRDAGTAEEYEKFGLPFDKPIVDAAHGAWCNTLHLCGDGVLFEIVDSIPSAFVNWAIGGSNANLAEGRARSKRGVIGGVTPKPRIRTMTATEVSDEVVAAVKATGGRGLIVGPGCSISTDTPTALLQAARRAVERSSV